MFALPFFLLSYCDFKGTALYCVMVWSLIGAMGMYCIELMAIKVDGFKNYFSDGWNLLD
jgi:hypothetical protein